MCVCENTETHQFVDGSTTTCEAIPEDNTETENPQDGNTDTPEPGTETPQTQNPTRRTSGGDSESKAARVIGIVGIGMAMYAIANGGLVSDSFAFSPDFGYDITESGYAINGGGKISYSEGDLQMYWTAKQTNANGKFGDFRYTSGGKYTADIWTATFSESVAGETAKYSFGLSADMDGYFIGISPVYRLHSFLRQRQKRNPQRVEFARRFPLQQLANPPRRRLPLAKRKRFRRRCEVFDRCGAEILI